jgi:hypothetical protein
VRTKNAPRVVGTCRICGRVTTNALVVKGKPYIDQHGERQVAADSVYHRECFSMQRRGLLNAGSDRPQHDSTGRRCCGCNSLIESGERHAHRNGQPYHKECLT